MSPSSPPHKEDGERDEDSHDSDDELEQLQVELQKIGAN
jgi:hypothetical protein